MIPLVPFVFCAYFLLYAFAFSISLPQTENQQRLGDTLQHEHTRERDAEQQSSLDEWVKRQEKIALEKLLANITPGGINAAQATPGTVLASPSREHPDYYYQCMPPVLQF